jgi:hypothetical protein
MVHSSGPGKFNFMGIAEEVAEEVLCLPLGFLSYRILHSFPPNILPSLNRFHNAYGVIFLQLSIESTM